MPFSQSLKQIITELKAGKIVAIPTETVYGLAADANNFKAIEKIFQLKGRLLNQPLAILIPTGAALEKWTIDISKEASQLSEVFWPGPLTLILKKAETVSDLITAGRNTIGLRMPDHALAQKILQHFPGGLVATSANYSGETSAITAEQVQAIFKDKITISKDETRPIGQVSTVVDCSQQKIKFLRQGAIRRDSITRSLKKNI